MIAEIPMQSPMIYHMLQWCIPTRELSINVGTLVCCEVAAITNEKNIKICSHRRSIKTKDLDNKMIHFTSVEFSEKNIKCNSFWSWIATYSYPPPPPHLPTPTLLNKLNQRFWKRLIATILKWLCYGISPPVER